MESAVYIILALPIAIIALAIFRRPLKLILKLCLNTVLGFVTNLKKLLMPTKTINLLLRTELCSLMIKVILP